MGPLLVGNERKTPKETPAILGTPILDLESPLHDPWSWRLHVLFVILEK